MKIKFKPKSHPLADFIGNEVGEVININTIDGIEHINAIFKDGVAVFLQELRNCE